jgi:hypothetical protein
VAVEHLPDRRARSTTDPGQAARPEVGLPAGPQDRLLLGGAEAPRLTVGRARPIRQPASCPSLCFACKAPAVPPAVSSRRRHVEGGSCRPQRHPRLDRFDQRQPPRWSESGVTVNLHPGPPCLGVRTQASWGPPDGLSGVHNVCGGGQLVAQMERAIQGDRRGFRKHGSRRLPGTSKSGARRIRTADLLRPGPCRGPNWTPLPTTTRSSLMRISAPARRLERRRGSRRRPRFAQRGAGGLTEESHDWTAPVELMASGGLATV